jgi:prevent-host-death family protein
MREDASGKPMPGAGPAQALDFARVTVQTSHQPGAPPDIGLSPVLWCVEAEVETFNMHAAKSQLSKLVQRASLGETILIASSGQPLARLMPLESDPDAIPSRLGFLAGRVQIPDDFDQFAAAEIAADFAGE